VDFGQINIPLFPTGAFVKRFRYFFDVSGASSGFFGSVPVIFLAPSPFLCFLAPSPLCPPVMVFLAPSPLCPPVVPFRLGPVAFGAYVPV
jgi:hypothetical protein